MEKLLLNKHTQTERDGISRMLASKRKTTMRDRMLQFFAYAHLPAQLQAISAPFGDLASHMVDTLPMNPERTAGLRKLLEAKDCAVRAVLYRDEETHASKPATQADVVA